MVLIEEPPGSISLAWGEGRGGMFFDERSVDIFIPHSVLGKSRHPILPLMNLRLSEKETWLVPKSGRVGFPKLKT